MIFFRSNKLNSTLSAVLRNRRNDTKMTKIKIIISNKGYTKKVLKILSFCKFLLNISHQITTDNQTPIK